MKITMKKIKFFFFSFVNYMLIYVKITDRQTDKYIKTIVRNLTKIKKLNFLIYVNFMIILC